MPYTSAEADAPASVPAQISMKTPSLLPSRELSVIHSNFLQDQLNSSN
jgi:hypothetical protein